MISPGTLNSRNLLNRDESFVTRFKYSPAFKVCCNVVTNLVIKKDCPIGVVKLPNSSECLRWHL